MRVFEGEILAGPETHGSRSRFAELAVDGASREFLMAAGLPRSQLVRMTHDVLSRDNQLLRDSIAGRTALIVMSPSIHELYGRRVRAYFDAPEYRGSAHFMVLDRSESTKSLSGVVEVCERATAAGLRRTSPVVAIGGGVCSDICGLAAALHRRGIPHINVPTTLVGLVDAGIGIKNAVNHEGHKSALGSFHPPEHSLLDPVFLASLPRRHLLNGMAEIAKLAIVRDQRLFALLRQNGVALVESGFRTPPPVAEEVIWRAVGGMLSELTHNPFEIGDLRRPVDFGHTFSPHIEVASGHAVLHGEAVAMDVALSAQLAYALGLLGRDNLDSILGLLLDLGLTLAWSELRVEELWASLTGIVRHRDGALHLVVPASIGRCAFLPQGAISPQLLEHCQLQLMRRGQPAHEPRSPDAAPKGAS